MNTIDVISLKETELVPKLKEMKLEEIEFHTSEIMKEMGSDDYKGLMKKAMQTLEETSDQSERYSALKTLIQNFLPNQAYMSDIYGRLAAMIMLILSRKYQQLLQA